MPTVSFFVINKVNTQVFHPITQGDYVLAMNIR